MAITQPWMPGVQKIDRGGGTPVSSDGPTVVVLHTTETKNPASYAGTEPHFEVSPSNTIQYVSLANTAKALYNAPGGVETNRRRGRIIQIEIVGYAGSIADISDAHLDRIAEVLRFVRAQLPFPLAGPPQGFHGADEGIYPYIASEGSPIRFSFAAWEAFGGICGHQHVPENDHWDPGHFPLARLLQRLGATSQPPPPSTGVPPFEGGPYGEGDEGVGVRVVQTKLIELGYPVGASGADGDFGPATDGAVRAFQRDHGLNDDGVVGQLTWNAMWTVKPAQPPVPPAPPAPLLILTAQHSHQVLEVQGASDSNGAAIGQWPLNSGKHQMVRLHQVPNEDQFVVVFEHNGKALDEDSGGSGRVQLWEVNGWLNQRWRFVPKAGGTFQLINVASGRALDVYGNDPNPGQVVTAYQPNDGLNQLWTITVVG